MRVVGICRFSHVGRGDWKAYQGKDASEMEALEKQQADTLFTSERMEARLRTFEQLTLASLEAQSDPDFLFVVLSSTLMPQTYRDRLVRLCETIPQVRLRFSSPCTITEAQKAAFKAFDINHADTIQVRLDDDDCLPNGFVEEVKKICTQAGDTPAFAITLSNCLYSVTHGPAAGAYHWPVSFLAAGLGLRHPRKSIFEFGHFALEKRFPNYRIADKFSLVTHNGNNDTSVSLDQMIRRGMHRVEGAELKTIVDDNFGFLSAEAKEMSGLSENTTATFDGPAVNASVKPSLSVHNNQEVLDLPEAPIAELNKSIDVPPSPETNPDWLASFAQDDVTRGFFIYEKQFSIQFSDRRSDKLYVSFDNLGNARSSEKLRDPWGYAFAKKMGWSHLGVMAYQPKWFRHARLYKQFDWLKETGFFERYKQVIFSGTSMGGYAACAFSSIAPGSYVVAFSPQSTLDNSITPWDRRYHSGTVADWTGPFADAAAELQAARKAWIIFDPLVPEDRQHAARLANPNVELLSARYSGHFTAQYLAQIGILSTVMRDAVDGNLSPSRFRNLYRKGRDYRRYLLGVAETAMKLGSNASSLRVARVLRARGRPAIANSLLSHAGKE